MENKTTHKQEQTTMYDKKPWNAPSISVICYKLTADIGHSGNPDGAGTLRTGGV